jgi:hypothetical protein
VVVRCQHWHRRLILTEDGKTIFILTAADCREEHPALVFKRMVLVPYLEFLEKPPNKGGRIITMIDAACFLLTIFEQLLATPLKSYKCQKQCPAQHQLMSATQ